MYKSLNEKMLFDYYMVHSQREDVFCETPYFIDEKYIDKFEKSCEQIHNIVLRIMNGINHEFQDFKPFIPDFPYKDKIINLKNPISPMFWVRFDGFTKEGYEKDYGLFYSELNYDKPCAQRECIAMEDFYYNPNNTNFNFKKHFIDNYYEICKEYFPNKKTKTAILSAPSRYEERHLSLLFKDILTDDMHEFILVNPTNLYVENEKVYAFGEEIDIVLRLYPTEYSYEINQFEEILDLFEQNKVLLLNDPRVIIGQCKNLYTYLWELIKKDDDRLSTIEKQLIKEVFPYTTKLTKDNIPNVQERKKYVIKPVYGRYSIDVFIGEICTNEEWEKVIEYLLSVIDEKEFILQEFCRISSVTVPFFDGCFTKQIEAYVNLGTYLSNNKYIGLCTRWNPSYLTSEEMTWITPVVKKENYIERIDTQLDFKEISTQCILDYGFSGSYTNNTQHLNLNPLVIKENKINELKEIINKLTLIFKKTEDFIIKNIDLYSSLLGISENVKDLLKTHQTNEFCFLSRIDCILDINNVWKVLEINAETPAGICESIYIDELIYDKLNNNSLKRINHNLKYNILKQAKKILSDYEKIKTTHTLALVSSPYYEDWYTINSLYEIIKEINPNIKVVKGSIYDLKVIDENVYLYEDKIDCMFRYYPLDWFEKEETKDLKIILDLLKDNVLSLNPLSTIIPQSKTFFAIIFELIKYNFYSLEEVEVITKHLPFTSLSLETMPTPNFLTKELLNREGKGITLSYEIEDFNDIDVNNTIFQNLIYAQTLKTKVINVFEEKTTNLYPIFGIYVTGLEFAGIYTRLGSIITNTDCLYTPLYIKKTI